MADSMDFIHHVDEIPAGAPLARPLERQVEPKVTPVPDLQGTITKYASDTNWMSAIGSTVAAKASTAIATKLGAQMGQNPHGQIGIGVPITDFDKTMMESYRTQAQATLGLQADKLISDSNLEMAKADRITPDLIQKTNESISKGLQDIYKNAPPEIVPAMQKQYGQLQIQQANDLTQRMIKEQHQDMLSNADMATQVNTEHAYSFALNGNDKAAVEAVETTRKMNESLVARRLRKPEESKSKIDAARQSYLSGKIVHDYEASPNKEEFLKSIADKKPSYLSDTDFQPVINNLSQHVNQQLSLRNMDEKLRVATFETNVSKNPNAADMPQQIQDLKSNVSPITFQKAQMFYNNKLASFNKDRDETNQTISMWHDSTALSRSSSKSINSAFDKQVVSLVQQRQNSDNPINIDDAEVQVAASAAVTIPVYQTELENKLTSGNPINILSASSQMESLKGMEAARAYSGVSQKAKAIAYQFQAQRGTMPDTDLARKITDNLSNIDKPTQDNLNNAWKNQLSIKGVGSTRSSLSFSDFALNEVGHKNDDFGGKYFSNVYGNDIYNQLNSNFMTTRGDYPTALKMTQDYVNEHYGESYVNGSKQFVENPVEKFLGLDNEQGAPYVQQDMLNQLTPAFAKAKESNPNDYWESMPLKNGVAEVSRHVMTYEGMKTYRYPVNLVGRAGNKWDVVVQTPNGNRNLFLVAPHVGVSTYIPNKQAIYKAYNSTTHEAYLSGTDKALKGLLQ